MVGDLLTIIGIRSTNLKIEPVDSHQTFLVVTDKCSDRVNGSPCEGSTFGKARFGLVPGFSPQSSYNWNLGRRLTEQLEWPKLLNGKGYVEALEDSLIYNSSKEWTSYYRPLAKLYVYCPPCACQIQTAIGICRGLGVSPLLERCVRVHDRLPSSCLPDDQALERLQSIHKMIQEAGAARSRLSGRSSDLGCIDPTWLDQRIFQLEQDAAGSQCTENPSQVVADMIAACAKGTRRTAAVIVLGELSCATTILEDAFKTQSPRKPRETDLYEVKHVPSEGANTSRWERRCIGAYLRAKDFIPVEDPGPSKAV